MAIYLDTSVLPLDSDIGTLKFSVLRALSKQCGQTLKVPAIALAEGVAHRRREMEATLNQLSRFVRKANGLGAHISIPSLPDPSERAEAWKADITKCVEIMSLPEGAGEESLIREVERKRPTRDGKGACDAAIWLSIKKDHQQTSEKSYFVSQNTKDFADFSDRTALHPDLVTELNATDCPLIYCNSHTALVEQLADQVDESISRSELQESESIIEVLLSYVGRSEMLRALFGISSGDVLYVAGPVNTHLKDIRNQAAYKVDDTTVSVVWTTWMFDFPLGVLSGYLRRGLSQELLPAQVSGDFQFWLKMDLDSKIVDAEIATSQRLVGSIMPGSIDS